MATKFQVVELMLDGSTKSMPQFGQFENGRLAAAFVKLQMATAPTGVKYQTRPVIVEIDWRAREAARMADGTYTPLLWADRLPLEKDHFAHIAKNGGVAFIQNEDKAKADLQTVTTVRSYLAKYFPELSGHERLLIEAVHNGVEDFDDLQFAKTPEEIEQVYRNGPESCMSYGPDSYIGERRPVAVYGAGDLAVAYIKDHDDDIVARTLVWPDKKIYARIYVDDNEHSPRMEAKLQAAGYLYDDSGFHGARLLKREIEGEDEDGDWRSGFEAPYLDVVGYLSEHEDGVHLTLDVMGMIEGGSTSGITCEAFVHHCQDCGGHHGGNRYYNGKTAKYCCHDCAVEKGIVCVINGTDHDLASLDDGRSITKRYLHSHTFKCPLTGRLTLKREGIVKDSGLVSPFAKDLAA